MSEQFLQQIDYGAKKLFEIAVANDKANLIFKSQALSNGLNSLSLLHELCATKKANQIIDWLGLPTHHEKIFFIHFTAAVLKKIQDTKVKGARIELSDYDHFVLMAIAETLSEIMWEDKKQVDIPGPAFIDCVDEYGIQDLEVILQIFIKNYIGNILQYVFEATKVRMANPKLPPETEVELKEKNAVAISGYVFSDFTIGGNLESNTKKIIETLNLAHQLIRSNS